MVDVDAGNWSSVFPGKYLDGGKAAGGQLVDQRLLPRISEGDVRILMAGDTCQKIIHKKPTGGGLSAVCGVGQCQHGTHQHRTDLCDPGGRFKQRQSQ